MDALTNLTDQTFISKEHEKQAYGITSPGPGTAKPYTSSGSQQLSNKTTSPTWGFGTSKVEQQEEDSLSAS